MQALAWASNGWFSLSPEWATLETLLLSQEPQEMRNSKEIIPGKKVGDFF